MHPKFYYLLLILVSLLPTASGQNREVLGEYKIGIIGRDQEDTIYQAVHLGAKDAARKLSEKYSIDVELLIATPNEQMGSNVENKHFSTQRG